MKKSFILYLALVFLMNSEVIAEDNVKLQTSKAHPSYIKVIADRLCPMFAKDPASFVELSDKDWVTCEYYESNEKEAKSIKGKCYVQQVSGASEPVKLTVKGSGGSCSSSSVAKLSSGNRPEAQFIELANSSVNGYGFGENDVILNSFPSQVLVTNQKRSDLRLITNNGAYVLCGFTNQLRGYLVSDWKNSSVCEKFANDQFAVAETQMEDPKQADALYRGELPPLMHVENVSEIDIDGDGKKEKILNLEYASGAGCGCDISGLSLGKSTEEDSKKAEDIDNQLEKLVKSVSSDCRSNDKWLPLIIDGKAYISSNYQTREISETPFPDRVLYKYEENDFVEVCRLKPDSKRMVDKDISSPGALSYTPVK